MIFKIKCKQYFIQNNVHTNIYNNLYMTKQIQYNERDTEVIDLIQNLSYKKFSRFRITIAEIFINADNDTNTC